ncbi:PAP2 superfamily protein [Flavobacteriaceae bacterium MAR_2010_188]|nr:PAP2 superfamily protein [Flavobacteriaceae bacterium MAR_2010_188]
MKLKLNYLSTATLLLLLVGSCERNELDFEESVDTNAQKTYNNGMIKSYDTSVLFKWNEALSIAVDAKLPPPAEARIYAMVTIAMHDALNNIVPKYETYALDNSAVNAKEVSKKNISDIANAAVSQAAHDVMIKVFPLSKTNADNLLNECLSAIVDSEYKDKGIEVGKNAASAMLAKRQNDFPLLFKFYDQGTEPGTYQSNFMPFAVANPPVWPAHAAYAPDLGQIMPFGMESSDQFRAIPPYGLNSDAYTADYNEVKSLGCITCPDRTAEQSEIGTFWIENLASSMNRIAREMATRKNLNGWETARLIALTQMAQIDANISSFEGKYYYKLWRPVTAIRTGEEDGNPQTIGDPSWTNGFTPPTPTYPSTHAETGGAAAELFKQFFRSDDLNLTLNSPYDLPDVERNIETFSQMAYEVGVSRIYIGYHFRNDVVQGEIEGRRLGKFIYENRLRELKPNL